MDRAVAVAVGFVGLLALLAAALVWSIPSVEADLAARADQELAAASIEGVSVEFDGRNGHVDGARAGAAEEELAALRGARWVRAERMPPPVVTTTTPSPPKLASLRMTRTSATTVRLAGTVATEADRQALINEVVGAGLDVDDALEIDAKVDGSYLGALVYLIRPVLDGSDDGELALIDGTAAVDGTAFDPVEAEEIEAAIAQAVAAGLMVEKKLSIVELSEDQQIVALQVEIDQIFDLARAIEGQNPSFGANEQELSPAAALTLDRVAVAMRRYPLPSADIIGHTDSQASEESNQTLSETRAAAVMTYLTDRDVDRSRLTSTGRGETEPIADNNDEAGRAENRRVEFVVRKSKG